MFQQLQFIDNPGRGMVGFIFRAIRDKISSFKKFTNKKQRKLSDPMNGIETKAK